MQQSVADIFPSQRRDHGPASDLLEVIPLSGRHVAPRHKAPRSITKSTRRLLGEVASVVPSSSVTTAVAFVGVAGVAVGAGVLTADPSADTRETAADVPAASTQSISPEAQAALDARAANTGGSTDAAASASSDDTSRSLARPALPKTQRATKHAELPVAKQDMAGAVVQEVAPTDPKDIAISMLGDYGWSSDQFSCLDTLYMHESGWNVTAENPYSGAYGLGQALPGSKMAPYGSDWATNPETQLKWGLAYIQDRYGSPCGAWGFWESHGYY